MSIRQVTLAWNPNTETDFAGHKLYTGPSSRNYDNVIDIGNQTSYTIQNIVEGQALSFTISATDPDGDTLSYTTNNLPSGASFNENTKTFAWTPTYNQTGTYSNITFQVSDGKDSDSESIIITVGNINRPPVLNTIADIFVSEGATITLNPTAIDPDGDVSTYTYSGWMTSASYTTDSNDAAKQ